MAIGLIAGMAIYGAAAGTVVAGVTITAGAAAAMAVVGGAAVAYASNKFMDSMAAGGGGGTSIVQLGDKAQPIDKTKMAEASEQKPLNIGEDEDAKKRAKGKAAFKIDLDAKDTATEAPAPDTGAQVAKVETGVQL